MTRITLGCGLTTSAVAFGTASLHHLSAGDADRLLRGAIDLGLHHFDTAPLYGAGLCETWVGRALADHPDVTVTTKVGLRSPFGETRTRAGMLAQKLAGRLAGKVLPGLSRPQVVRTIAHARRSLDGSLRRLRRDVVDVLMIHEPDAAIVNTDEWLNWLESERGRARFIGLAGSPERLQPFVGRAKGWAMQTSIAPSPSLSALEAAGAEIDFTYGHLSGSAGPRDVTALLREARRARPRTAIIASTRRLDRLAAIAGALA